MTDFVLAGGCFWCVDAALRQLRGVSAVVCGYTGGTVEHPSYEQVCTGETGHAEAVRVSFDPAVLPVQVLLDAYFTLHDPTTLDRQGNDVGTQYRSAMFYADDEQRVMFLEARERASQWWVNPIVTTVQPLTVFYPAEEYHQDYYAKNPGSGYCQVVVSGKVAKIRARFRDYLEQPA